MAICIGPCCIPLSAIWPLLLILLRPLWNFISKLIGVDKKPATTKTADDKSTSEVENSDLATSEKSNCVELVEESDWQRLISSDKLTIVRFTASWCKPCKRIAPHYFDLSDNHSNVQFLTVDLDKFSNLAVECGVVTIPLFQAYRKGKLLDKSAGEDQVGLSVLVERYI
mmetsp:Transcript_11578/g.11594  ORF Transcript_11578/g.11594 Transcript_11578/m.11594 type:complete len:169 (+) Transcript_11578:41-547(+)